MAAAPGSVTVGLSISTMDNPFFVALRDGAQAEAKAVGINLITVDAQNDAAKQIAGVEDLIQKKVPVILLNPTDSDAVANVVKEAAAAGIKVISLDRAVNGAEVSSHIASDNVAGGKMAGEFLLKKLGGKGNLVELEGIPGSSAARERGEGFDSAIAGKPGVKLVAKQPANFDRAQGLTVMENILQGNKDIQGVFAQNDEMALGARTSDRRGGSQERSHRRLRRHGRCGGRGQGGQARCDGAAKARADRQDGRRYGEAVDRRQARRPQHPGAPRPRHSMKVRDIP